MREVLGTKYLQRLMFERKPSAGGCWVKEMCDESQVRVGIVLLSCLDFFSSSTGVYLVNFLLSIIVRQSGLVRISIFSRLPLSLSLYLQF